MPIDYLAQPCDNVINLLTDVPTLAIPHCLMKVRVDIWVMVTVDGVPYQEVVLCFSLRGVMVLESAGPRFGTNLSNLRPQR